MILEITKLLVTVGRLQCLLPSFDKSSLRSSLKFLLPSVIYAVNNNIYFGKNFNIHHYLSMCLQLVWFLFHLLSGLFSAPSEQLSPVLFTSLFSGEMWLHSSLWDLSWLFWGLPIIWHFFLSHRLYKKSENYTNS